MRLQKLLADFVFRDSRLESHPKILATHVRVVSRDSTLNLVAEVSKSPLPFLSRSLDLEGSLSGRAWDKRAAIIHSESRDTAADFLQMNSVQSFLLVPILDGAEALGVISLMSTEKDFFGQRARPAYKIATSTMTTCPDCTKSTAVAIRAAIRRKVGQ
jgi:GAF domain-containing protein